MAPALAIEWENVNLAGAFLIGVVFGTVVTLRVLHIAFTIVKREERRDR